MCNFWAQIINSVANLAYTLAPLGPEWLCELLITIDLIDIGILCTLLRDQVSLFHMLHKTITWVPKVWQTFYNVIVLTAWTHDFLQLLHSCLVINRSYLSILVWVLSSLAQLGHVWLLGWASVVTWRVLLLPQQTFWSFLLLLKIRFTNIFWLSKLWYFGQFLPIN